MTTKSTGHDNGRLHWRKPTEADKQRAKCKARSEFERNSFDVTWNAEWNCWALHGRPHILTHVSEIHGR